MSDYHPTSRRPIAEVFRATARRAVRLCVSLGIHPDLVSYGSIIASLVAAACLLYAKRWPWLLLVGPLFCYARLWLNMLDGMVAIASGKASRRGEILNELPDRISDVLVFAAVAHSGLVYVPMGYWTAIAALMTAYVGTLGQAVTGAREYGGVMSKPWRMVMLHVGAGATWAAMQLDCRQAFWNLSILDWTCLLIMVGCVQTIAVRLSSTIARLRSC